MRLESDFLSFDDIILIHENQIELYGGAVGIRDEGLLYSALSMPQSKFSGEFLHHGHIHSSSDYKIGNTRVVCNPKGYSVELNKNFKPNLVLEV